MTRETRRIFQLINGFSNKSPGTAGDARQNPAQEPSLPLRKWDFQAVEQDVAPIRNLPQQPARRKRGS